MTMQSSRRLLSGALLMFAIPQLQADPIFANGFESEQAGGGGASGTDFVNDTGVSSCADAFSAGLPCPQAGYPDQDGEQGRDALARKGLLDKIGGGVDGFDFTKISKDGNPLLANATLWSCVQDNVTGLMWEVKVDSPSSVRDWEYTFSWYDPNPATNGGSAGNPGWTSTCNNKLDGANCNTYEYIRYVNAHKLCNHQDWRLPSRRELLTIVRRGATSPRIDTNYFKPFNQGYGESYWSSTRAAEIGGGIWQVNFAITGTSTAFNTADNFVMLVRGGTGQ